MNELNPHPSVVVVTGASAGVGRAVARAFAAPGVSVALIARGLEGLEGARRDVEAAGGQALVLPLDVADADAVEAAAERVEREVGPIDVWVNNATVTVFAPFSEIEADEFRRVTEVTYLGYVYGTQSALRRMRQRDQGVVVQVGSALAYRGIPLQSAYCGAKHAIEGFTESVRTELMHEQSRVHLTMVQLPAINTPQFSWSEARLPRRPQPVPPIYQPEVAARAVVFAATHRRREVMVGCPTYLIVEGNKLFPSLGDWYLAKTGYESQQTDEPIEPDRRSNLWEPVDGDQGAHGAFGQGAYMRSPMLWATIHRDALAVLAAALAAMTSAVVLRWRR